MTVAARGLRPGTVFAPERQWQAWLDVEAALARAQARLGLIPEAAAREISAQARLERIDVAALRASIARTLAPVLSLTRCLAEATGESGRWVHWGATTQNVMQTGRLLLLREAHRGVLAALARAVGRLGRLAADHADTPMAGRTNRRHALPITLGFKAAGWIEELDRAAARLTEAAGRSFSLPFGGAVGAHHAYAGHGRALMRTMAAELGLAELMVPGRTVNDLFVEYVVQLALLGMTFERIARELYLLMTEELQEIHEVLEPGVVGSSTMPHKVNPKHVVKVLAECARLRALAAPAMEAGLPSHEGDAAANHLLAAVLDEAVPLAWTLAERVAALLERVAPDPARMAANLALTGPLLATERLTMALAPETGRGRAHDLVHHALEGAPADPMAALLAVPEIAALGADRVRALLDPACYTGDSAEIARTAADRAAALARALGERVK